MELLKRCFRIYILYPDGWGFVTVVLTIQLQITGLQVYLEQQIPNPDVQIHPLFKQ